MPGHADPAGGIPRGDLAPLVLGAVVQPFVKTAANVAFEDNRVHPLVADGVSPGGPPARESLREYPEGDFGRTGDRDRLAECEVSYFHAALLPVRFPLPS
jgi:hypothetical protein